MLHNFMRIGAQAAETAGAVAEAAGSGDSGTFWMPPQASTVAANTDALFYFIYYLCMLFFVLIVGAMVLFIIKYRRKEGQVEKSIDFKGNHTLEVLWSVIPGVLLLVIFGWGFKDWVKMVVPPANAIDVRVTGQKWNWSFDYSSSGVNGAVLVVPENKPVRLTMSSKDVLHSFFIPAMRIKRDVLPGRYTVQWFEAKERGEFPIACTEYCGTEHSTMLTKVRVVSQEEFDKWISEGGDLGGAGVPPEKLGATLYEAKGCNACHSLDGSVKIGPTFKGLYGRNSEMADGTQVPVDDNYLRESILQPQLKIVKGMPPVMPSFQGQLNDKQIAALIEFIKAQK